MSAPLSAQAVLRNTVQMRQMNTWQHSGQTVIVSTTQALQKTTECSASVNQPAGFTNFGEDDMMWVSLVGAYQHKVVLSVLKTLLGL